MREEIHKFHIKIDEKTQQAATLESHLKKV
jgi:hypothetical protein